MYRHWLIVGLLASTEVATSWAEEIKVEAAPTAAAPAKDEAEKPVSPAADNAPPEISKATPEQLQQWVQDLVNPRFAVRQTASQKLVQSGTAGMEAVTGAAQTNDLELATRCLSVLKEGLNSKSKEVQQVARTALQTLAKSENNSVAQRARTALEAPPKLGVPAGRFPGGIQGNFQQIAVQINNGARQIKVTENGKEIAIKDNNGKDITITTTETVNGQKVSKSVTAKDEDDLKKNHAEAHALFEKYSKGNNGIQIKFGMNAIGNGIIAGQLPVPGAINRPLMVNRIKAAETFGEIDKLRQKLEESNERLAKSAESEKPDPADLKSISAEIKSLTKRLSEIKTELGLP